MRRAAFLLLLSAGLIAGASIAVAQPKPGAAPPAQAPAPAAAPQADAPEAPPPPLASAPGTILMLRGLDKITGKPTDISAPIGKPVHFATLTITARYCYSTPASETPETSAFVQVEDHRPDRHAGPRVAAGRAEHPERKVLDRKIRVCVVRRLHPGAEIGAMRVVEASAHRSPSR